MSKPRRRATGEAGASLLLALGFLALCGALIPAIVNLSGTNQIDTSRLHEQRNGVYAADGAVDGAIQYLREHTGCGRASGFCPTGNVYSATLNGTKANVSISLAPFNELDRKVELKATLEGETKVLVDAVGDDSRRRLDEHAREPTRRREQLGLQPLSRTRNREYERTQHQAG